MLILQYSVVYWKFIINKVGKEVQHEIEFVTSKCKYQLTMINLKANSKEINYKLMLTLIDSSYQNKVKVSLMRIECSFDVNFMWT